MDTGKKKPAVIFDCDGVMFESRNANINFYNHILTHFGLPPMTEDKVSFVHMHTADESIRHIFHGTPFVENAQAYRTQMDYSPFIRDMIIEPGLKELLGQLRPDFGLAVATNRSNTIEKVLEWNDLNRHFDIVVSSLDVENPKPDPESLFKILDYFDIGPNESFYVGDSLVDCQTARAAGVIFIAYKDRALDADFYADSMTDIAEFVNSGNRSGR